MERVILHSDMNSFYASVECMKNPDLKRIPMVVGGSPEKRHGIVLAKNQIAKNYGITTGEALWAAKEKCPHLYIQHPDYKSYMRCSRIARKIYYRYSECVEPFGPDEAWIDLTGNTMLSKKSPEAIAYEIKEAVKESLGLTVSIGVSFNKVFAKFGSDYKKPDAVTCIYPKDVINMIYPAPVEDLLCIGRATKKKLNTVGIYTIGQLAASSRAFMRSLLGKNGEILWYFAKGDDQSFVKTLNTHTIDSDYPVKSIGNALTAPRDLVCDEEVHLLIAMLSECVGKRMREQKLRTRCIEIYLRDSDLISCTRQHHLIFPTELTSDIIAQASSLYCQERDRSGPRPIRSVGVRVSELESTEAVRQMNFFEDTIEAKKKKTLEDTMDHLSRRFGNLMVRRAVTMGDKDLSELDFKATHTIHPVGFFA